MSLGILADIFISMSKKDYEKFKSNVQTDLVIITCRTSGQSGRAAAGLVLAARGVLSRAVSAAVGTAPACPVCCTGAAPSTGRALSGRGRREEGQHQSDRFRAPQLLPFEE